MVTQRTNDLGFRRVLQAVEHAGLELSVEDFFLDVDQVAGD